MKRTHSLRVVLYLYLLLAVSASVSAAPFTIVSLSGSFNESYAVGGMGGAYQTIYVGWSSTSAYSNVDIFADLGSFGSAWNGVAYLTSQVGPGTSVAHEIASGPFSVANGFVGPVNVLSLLSLPSGTYYLTLFSTDQTGNTGWFENTSGTVTTDTGVTYLGDGLANNVMSSVDLAYPPASNFNTSFEWGMLFSVQGEAAGEVPEPGTWLLVGGGLTLLGVLRRRSKTVA